MEFIEGKVFAKAIVGTAILFGFTFLCTIVGEEYDRRARIEKILQQLTPEQRASHAQRCEKVHRKHPDCLVYGISNILKDLWRSKETSAHHTILDDPIFNPNGPDLQELLPETKAWLDGMEAEEWNSHLSWCDKTYHQTPDCPKYLLIQVPEDVIAQQKANFIAWCKNQETRNVSCPDDPILYMDPEEKANFIARCDKTYHQTPDCPKFGHIVKPKEVLAEERADHIKWCDNTHHMNPDCPKFGQIGVSKKEMAEVGIDVMWCDEIFEEDPNYEFKKETCVAPMSDPAWH